MSAVAAAGDALGDVGASGGRKHSAEAARKAQEYKYMLDAQLPRGPRAERQQRAPLPDELAVLKQFRMSVAKDVEVVIARRLNEPRVEDIQITTRKETKMEWVKGM